MLTNLLAYINTYGYKAIFLLIAIENLFPPIPCEIILTFGGFMTTITNLTPLGVITVASLGSYLGAVILYWFGYLINLERLEKLLVRFYFKRHDLSRSLNWFEQYGKISVLIGRLIPIVRSLISLPAGITKMNFFSFSFYTLIGTIIYCNHHTINYFMEKAKTQLTLGLRFILKIFISCFNNSSSLKFHIIFL